MCDYACFLGYRHVVYEIRFGHICIYFKVAKIVKIADSEFFLIFVILWANRTITLKKKLI